MATALIDSMSAEFNPREFKDHYREQLQALIEARAKGRPAPMAKGKPRAPTNVVDLASVLEKSLAEAKQTKQTKKTSGRTKTGEGRAGRGRPRAA